MQQEEAAGRSADNVASDQIVDISQNLSREPWCAGRVRSLTSGTRLYSFQLDRLLIPFDHFDLLGFRSRSLHFRGISKCQAFELASECMAQPVVSTVCLCLAVVLLKLGHRD